MKIRALAIISALALPTIALAEPSPPPPTTSGSPSDTTMKHDTTKADTGTPGTSDSSAKLSDSDVKIIAHLHHVNQMEIDLGKAAQKNGTANVKSYGATLVTDHQTNDKDLTAFAKSHKLATIPADKPQTDADKTDEKDMSAKAAKLKALKGADFDREFLNMMAMDHDKELTKVDTASGSASNPDLQAILKATKPVLQRHADQARDLQKNPPQAMNPSMTPASPTAPAPSTR
jgi:putative membrane protein